MGGQSWWVCEKVTWVGTSEVRGVFADRRAVAPRPQKLSFAGRRQSRRRLVAIPSLKGAAPHPFVPDQPADLFSFLHHRPQQHTAAPFCHRARPHWTSPSGKRRDHLRRTTTTRVSFSRPRPTLQNLDPMQRSLQPHRRQRQEQRRHQGKQQQQRPPRLVLRFDAAATARPPSASALLSLSRSRITLLAPPLHAAAPEATPPPPPPPPSDPAPSAARDGYRAAAVGAALSVLALLADHDAVDAHPQAAMAAVFIFGMAGVTLEELFGFSKAGVSLLMAASLWTIRATTPGVDAAMAQAETSAALASTSDLIFFLLSAMTVVEVVDAHGGFDGLAQALRPGGGRRRARAEGDAGAASDEASSSSSLSSSLLEQRAGLAAAVTASTFFMSALLDNLTTTIVVLSVVNRALADDDEERGGSGNSNNNSLASLRLLLGGLVVIAANAGGAWTPIGDVTTTLLWVQGHLSPWPTVRDLFLPSLACAAAPLALLAATAPELQGPVLLQGPSPSPGAPSAGAAVTTTAAAAPTQQQPSPAAPRSRRGGLVLGVGIGALLFSPIFREATHLPASMGALAGLSALWLVTDALHWGEDRAYPRVNEVISRVDVGGALFFAGVLLSVGALEAGGVLSSLAQGLREALPPGPWAIAAALGVASALVDNVPLVAAASSMFGASGGAGGADAAAMAAAAAGGGGTPMDDPLWQLTAYCAGTGGSLLIIGSASGIALMSLMRGAGFGWYLRRVGPVAALGYACGMAVYALEQQVGWFGGVVNENIV